MLNVRKNRNAVARARELIRVLREKESRVASAILSEQFATLVAQEARERLARDCESDDDSEYYALCDKIALESFTLIENLLNNALQ
jgi:hypothetical protein